MKESTDKKGDLDEDALIDAESDYDSYIEDNIGYLLKRRPSAKQRSQIIAEFCKDEEADFELLFGKYAHNCLTISNISDPRLLSRVERILAAFLPEDHGRFEELNYDNEDPPHHFKQILSKPTAEQIAVIVEALVEKYPDWSISYSNDGEVDGARKLASALGYTFQDLIKKNALAREFFGVPIQGQTSNHPPAIKKKGKSKGFSYYVILALLLGLLWLMNPFGSSSESSASLPTDSEQTKNPLVKSEASDDTKQDVITQEPQPITTLENTALPITLVSTEEITLLDKTGKLTIIPTGAIITVESRGAIGTLTTRINGALFVGNEERFAGKVIQK